MPISVKIKLDENLGMRGAARLRDAGHDVATVYGQGMTSSPDEKVIEICRSENRCLVTLDMGFSNPFHYDPRQYSGIVVLRIPREASAQELDGVISTLVEALEKSGVDGQLWIVQIGRVRIYRPEPSP